MSAMLAALTALSLLAFPPSGAAEEAPAAEAVRFHFGDGAMADCTRVKDAGPNDLAWTCRSGPFTGRRTIEVKVRRDTDRDIRLMFPIGILTPEPKD
jgi:hypothetical protein